MDIMQNCALSDNNLINLNYLYTKNSLTNETYQIFKSQLCKPDSTSGFSSLGDLKVLQIDLQALILGFLTLKDLMQCRQVCRYLRILCKIISLDVLCHFFSKKTNPLDRNASKPSIHTQPVTHADIFKKSLSSFKLSNLLTYSSLSKKIVKLITSRQKQSTSKNFLEENKQIILFFNPLNEDRFKDSLKKNKEIISAYFKSIIDLVEEKKELKEEISQMQKILIDCYFYSSIEIAGSFSSLFG
jgi:hypothetical protein